VAWYLVCSKKKKNKFEISMSIEKVIQNQECTIIDVRSAGEFQGGHVAGSINIPVNELTQRLSEVKALKLPLVLCCASGGRSAMASGLLKQQGITCYDGGSWLSVNYLRTQAVSIL
jgi:phage shock protein E